MASACYLIPGRDLATAVALARRAEALGYESLWVTHGLGRDSFLVLAAYGAATTRIGLANGVVPIYPRHPVAMAQAALTLNEMTAGRFRLGIGVSHRASMEQMLGLTLREPLEVMREYRQVIDELGAERTRATATSASRDAANRDAFFDPAERVLGVRPELISGETEAGLTFAGATAGLHEPAPFLVLDVGGGSTELIVGHTAPEGLVSVDIGCVRLTEQYLHGDPPAPEELSQAVSVVRGWMAQEG